MADPLYDRLLATANRLLNQYGKPATLAREVTTGPDYNPVISTNNYNVKLVETGYSLTERSNSVIQAGDRVGLIAADGESMPAHGDRIIIDGVNMALVDIQPLNPGGLLLLVEFVARS